jgi:DUF971 family protein
MPHALAITDHRLTQTLQIDWSDDCTSRLPYTLLRAGCRCAACEQLRRSGTPPVPAADVQLSQLLPVADQGLNLAFSDGHDRGIYPWSYLRALAPTTPD